MSRNIEKILQVLKLKTPGEITVSQLAEKTNINIKNISRYWKRLEREGKVAARTQQNGKIRTVYLKYTTRPIITPAVKKIIKEKIPPATLPKLKLRTWGGHKKDKLPPINLGEITLTNWQLKAIYGMIYGREPKGSSQHLLSEIRKFLVQDATF